MDPKIDQFLTAHQVCSLTTTLPDASLHAAALHFSHQNDQFQLYFSTERTSRKCLGLIDGKKVQAAVAIGFSEDEWVTLQLSGEIEIISNQTELTKTQKIHYAKHPDSAKYKDDPETVFLQFTPHWCRYTDFKSDPILVIGSK